MTIRGENANNELKIRRPVPLVAALNALFLACCGGAFGQQTNQASQKQAPPVKPIKHTFAEIQNAFSTAPSAHFRTSPKILNPHAQEALNPAILQDLKAQKLAASFGPSHTMGAAGDAGNSQNPAGGSSTPPGGGGDPAGNPSNPTGGASNPPGTPGGKPGLAGGNPSGGSSGLSRPGNPPPSSIGPSRSRLGMRAAAAPAPVAITPPPSSNSASKLGAKAPAPLQNICPPGPGPGVFNVNGKPTGAIFTQDPDGDDYTIVGCRFGNSKGEVHLEGGFRQGTIPLVVQSWSDTLIKAKVNAALRGESDENNVSLVIVPQGSPSVARIPGFRFYAMREQVTLRSFPQSGVTLGPITATDGQAVQATFSSPYTNYNSTGQFTAGVNRNHQARFDPGSDSWDLSGLAPGFVPVDFQFSYWAVADCGGGVLPAESTIYNDGKWDARWDPQNGNRILIHFAEQHCHRSPSLMQLGDDESNSSYALTITVAGPKGVDPWSK